MTNKYLEKIAGKASLISAGVGAGIGALAPADSNKSRLGHVVMGAAAGGLGAHYLGKFQRNNRIKSTLKGVAGVAAVAGGVGLAAKFRNAQKAYRGSIDAQVNDIINSVHNINV